MNTPVPDWAWFALYAAVAGVVVSIITPLLFAAVRAFEDRRRRKWLMNPPLNWGEQFVGPERWDYQRQQQGAR